MIFSGGSAASGPDISGTPSAGNYARWTDADTLDARTTAQVLSDIGAAGAMSGGYVSSALLSHAAYSNGEKITLPFAVSGGAADGKYVARIVWRDTGDLHRAVIMSWTIASNAVSGYGCITSIGGTSMASTNNVLVSGSALSLCFNLLTAASIWIEVWSSVAPSGSFSISDVTASGTACYNDNYVADMYMSGFLSMTGGVIKLYAANVGSAAGLAYISNGGLNDALWYNVPTGQKHWFAVQDVDIFRVTGAGVEVVGLSTIDSLAVQIATKTAVGPYAMSATDHTILCDATSNNVGITLPAQAAGRIVHLKRIDSSGNTVTITPDSGNVRGAASITLAASFAAGYEAVLVSNGTNWY